PVLQGSVRRADSRGRHHGSGIDVVVRRRRHGVRYARRQHDSVLHLLLDVRLPAHRRSDLGRRRRAHARVPPRWHGGAHDARGEGLQHQDGNSQLFALAYPNCVSYDPAFAYEIAVIIQDGIRRMYVDQESIFYYLTVMNEQYAMPEMPKGA